LEYNVLDFRLLEHVNTWQEFRYAAAKVAPRGSQVDVIDVRCLDSEHITPFLNNVYDKVGKWTKAWLRSVTDRQTICLTVDERSLRTAC